MAIDDLFLRLWLSTARNRWSRLRRGLLERRYLKTQLPSPDSLDALSEALREVVWTQDGPLQLWDSISYPQTVWHKKKDDCDGFAVLAAELLRRWDPVFDPVLLTALLRPIKQAHTVCVFREGDRFRFFDNSSLDDGIYASYSDVVNRT